MIQGKLLSFGDDLSEVYYIRRKVFVEEQGISEEDEFDEYDNEAIHVLVYEQGENNEVFNNDKSTLSKTAVATGRIIYDGDSCRIGNIAVLMEYRDKKYGDFTVRMLINRAFTAGIEKVFTIVQPENIGFFEKIGFQVIDKIDIPYKENIVKMMICIHDIKTCCKI